MPLYQIDVEKQMGMEFWTNRYLVRAASLTAAAEGGSRIVAAERDMHTARAFFTQYRARTVAKNDGLFVNVPVAQSGLRAADTSYLPLFNVMRVDFQVASGRPSRKFYRFPLQEGDVNDGVIGAGLVSSISDRLSDLIAAMADANTPIVDPDDQDWLNLAIYTPVGMRQLRRGSKRKAKPIL